MNSSVNNINDDISAMDTYQSGAIIAEEEKVQDDIIEDADDDQCAICLDGTTFDDNCILYCDKCNVAVHQTCYGVDVIPSGSWFCDVCRAGGCVDTLVCELCSNTGGAYKRCDKKGCWVHVLCALWIPEVYMPETGIYHISNIDKSRFRMRCRLCNTKGAIVQCAYGRCTAPVHPWCALKGNKGYTHRIVKSPDTPGLCYWEIFCASHADCVKDPVKPKPKAKRIHFLNDDDDKPDKSEKSDKPKRRGRKKKNEDVNGDSEDDEDDDLPPQTSAVSQTPTISETPTGHAMYGFTEWPGQAEGEAMDLFHFWNIVSMYYPEDYSEEWLSFMAEPFVDSSKNPIAGFDETMNAEPKFGSIEETMKLLEAANTEVLSVGAALSDREKVLLYDNNKRLQFCGQILRTIDLLQSRSRDGAQSPVVTSNANIDSEEYDSRSEISGQEDGHGVATATSAALSDIESRLYLDYATFLTSEVKNIPDYASAIISANSNIMSVVYSTVQGRLAAFYQMRHTADGPFTADSIDLCVNDPVNLWNNMGVLAPCVENRSQVSGSAKADLVSIETIDINKPIHLPNRTIIPRNDEDDICYLARSEKSLLRQLWNSITTRITSLFEEAKMLQRNATKHLEINPSDYDVIESSYLKQRTWKRVAQGVVRGMQDQSHDFNRPTEDTLPASWTIQVQGRPKPEDEEEEEQEDAVCMVCFDGSSCEGNRILFCDGCNAAVHQTCYGVADIPEGDFFCERCCRVRRLAESSCIDPGEEVRDAVTCCLCSQHHGGLKATTSSGQWVHLCCALWAPQTVIGDIGEMTAIDIRNVPTILNVKRRRNVYEHLETIRLENAKAESAPEMLPAEERGTPQNCIYCNQSMGYAVFCEHEHDGLCCTASFHPICAWFQGAYVSAINEDPTYLSEPYPSGLRFSYRCLEHSPVTSMSRDEQKSLRMKYHINENDLCVIPGFQKKRKNRKKNKATPTNAPKVKELNLDTYDDGLCGACMHPINHALSGAALPSVTCNQCKLTVHAKCVHAPGDPWLCELCQEGELQCAYCPRRGGIFSRTAEGKWAHIYCATYKVGFHRSDLKKEKKVSCVFCNRRSGNIVNCRQTGCTQSFHPLCAARSLSVYFQVQHGNKQAYCLEHIPNTVIRIPSGHWVNIEEVRRLRHSLDTARVILDRMQKREKLKRSYYKTKGESFALIATNMHNRLIKRLGGELDIAEDAQDIPDLEEILSDPDEDELEPTQKKRGRKKGVKLAVQEDDIANDEYSMLFEESFLEDDDSTEPLGDLEDISATWLNRKGQLAIPKHVYVAFSGQEVCINSGKQGRIPTLQDYSRNVKNGINRTVDASRTQQSIFSSQRSFAEFDRKLGHWVDHYLGRSLDDIVATAEASFVELEQELTVEMKRKQSPKDERPTAAQSFKLHQPVHLHAKLEPFTALYNRLETTPIVSNIVDALPKDEYNDAVCTGTALLALERNIFHVLDFISSYEIPMKEFSKYERNVHAYFDVIAARLLTAGRRKAAASDTFLLSDEFQAIPYEEFPNYDALVATPLALSVLKAKLQSHRYTSFGAFASDFYLMLSNARHVTEPATSTWWSSELLALLFKLLNEKLKSLAESKECMFFTISGQWVVMEPTAYYETLELSRQNVSSQVCPTCGRMFACPLVDVKAKANFDDNWKCVCSSCLDSIRSKMRGLAVQIYWTDDKAYYSGTVENFEEISGEHSIMYTDNQVEYLRIGAEPYLLNMKELKKRKLLTNNLPAEKKIQIKEESNPEVKVENPKTPKTSKIKSAESSTGRKVVKVETPVSSTPAHSSRKRKNDSVSISDDPQQTPVSKKKKDVKSESMESSPVTEAPRSMRKRRV